MLRAPPSRSSDSPPGPRGAQASQVAHAEQAHRGAHDSERPRRRRVPRTCLLGGVGVAAVLLVVGLLAFGPIVRSRIAKEGERRRLDVTVGSVRPGFFAVNLKDVHVKLQGVSGVEVRIDDVHVDLDDRPLGPRGRRPRRRDPRRGGAGGRRRATSCLPEGRERAGDGREGPSHAHLGGCAHARVEAPVRRRNRRLGHQALARRRRDPARVRSHRGDLQASVPRDRRR